MLLVRFRWCRFLFAIKIKRHFPWVRCFGRAYSLYFQFLLGVLVLCLELRWTRTNLWFLLFNNILCGLFAGLRLFRRGSLEVSNKMDSSLFLLLGLLGLLLEDVCCNLIDKWVKVDISHLRSSHLVTRKWSIRFWYDLFLLLLLWLKGSSIRLAELVRLPSPLRRH